jgi:glycoside/pentoside/hexuronide:cation symporter, GPH family
MELFTNQEFIIKIRSNKLFDQSINMSSSFIQKLSFSLIGFPFLLANTAIGAHTQYFYTEILKLDAKKTGFAWTLYSIFNSLCEPTVGYLSDNSNFKLFNSKRIPWILFGFLPWSFAFYMIWKPMETLKDDYLFYYLISVLILYGTMNAFIGINWMSLFTELFSSSSEKMKVSNFRVLFLICGMLSGMVLPPVLSSSWKNPSVVSNLSLILLLIGVFIYFASSNEISNVEKKEKKSFFENLKLSFQSKSYRAFLLSFSFLSLGNSLLLSFLPLFSKYIAKITQSIDITFSKDFTFNLTVESQTALILSSFYILGILATPFWTWMASKFGMIFTYQLECVIYATIIFLINIVNEGFWNMFCLIILMGLTMSGFIIFPDLILSLVGDEDELINKQGRRDGMFIGGIL